MLCCLFSAQAAFATFYVTDDNSANTAITKTVSSTNSTLKGTENTQSAHPTTTAGATHPAANSKTMSGKTAPKKATPKKAARKKLPTVPTYTVRSGSLKRNVEHIVRQAHWGQVVWSLPYDYRWVGVSHIQGRSVQAVLGKLLANYPVQAVFYQQNRVVQIKARPSIAYHQPKDLEHVAAQSISEQEQPHAS